MESEIHDPLCANSDYDGVTPYWECEHIAQVRADMLAKCVEAVDLCTTDKGEICRENKIGVEWAIVALEALREKP